MVRVADGESNFLRFISSPVSKCLCFWTSPGLFPCRWNGGRGQYLAPLLKFKEELRTEKAVGMTTQGSETAGNVCVL